MNVALQGIGIGALLIGFIGQWLAPRSPIGWLIGLVSAGLWVVPLTDGEQWAGVASCTVSMAICARNY